MLASTQIKYNKNYTYHWHKKNIVYVMLCSETYDILCLFMGV